MTPQVDQFEASGHVGRLEHMSQVEFLIKPVSSGILQTEKATYPCACKHCINFPSQNRLVCKDPRFVKVTNVCLVRLCRFH